MRQGQIENLAYTDTDTHTLSLNNVSPCFCRKEKRRREKKGVRESYREYL